MVKIQGMYKERLITEKLKRLVNTFPAVVLTGARQVGKSTLLTHIFPNFEHVTFDPVIDIGYSSDEPDIFLRNHPTPVILDEIQYAPELISAVKRRIDNDRSPGQYIITGSQQWAVMKNISEALTGRAVIVDMEGFSLSEIAGRITEKNWLSNWLNLSPEEFKAGHTRLPAQRPLFEQLWRGWLPEVERLAAEDIIIYLRSYIQTYVERDVRNLLDTSDWQSFGKFLQMISALTAQEMNYSRFGNDLDISPQTVRRWFSVIEGTFQWFNIASFSGNTLKRICRRQKGYFADTGLACSLNRISSHRSLLGHPIAGALFETAVVSEIRKLSTTLAMPPQFYHWRTAGGAEVDLIMERDGSLFPVEIKMTSNPGKKHLSGINAFRRTYPKLSIAPGLVICPCEKFVQISQTDYALPWDSV
ncbi:hypothetical protein SMSP2_02469 [Limihaloglobus sulfuriphilus]|uniref:GTP-binding protein n=1 Tax=Limihaloglobus sulfuriphilus TaxID=1851148 RepID=A0A1Q2MHG4_9BACT|nr:ATP-binding protein [Limihaloglobus sulfuriphilus]AQQ72089.1 hypothetical protein SMSP2_02469 [Limihaloglobus sulfuriphilus]